MTSVISIILLVASLFCRCDRFSECSLQCCDSTAKMVRLVGKLSANPDKLST